MRRPRDSFSPAFVSICGLPKPDDGNYLVIRVSEGTAQLGEHDPKAVAAALAQVLSSNEIVKHFARTELNTELLNALRGAIRLSEMRADLQELSDDDFSF
jgi:isocitrate dehydrogenase